MIRRRLGAGGAVAALLTAALTAVAPASSAADPNYQAPQVGQCSDMSAEELAAPSYVEAPVDCAAPHTAVTIGVVQMPDGLTYESNRLERFALESCMPAQRQVLGTSKTGMRLTAYNLAYFGPTAEQQAAGARWLRCDLHLGDPSAPQPLPAKLKVGKYPFATAVSRCLAGPDFHLTVCSSSHTYRATGALKVKAKRFPSEKAWQRLGTQRCRGEVSSRVYRFGWPSKVTWKAGDRTLLCYSKTRR
ncbi:hypothetical protein GCM10023339_05280 [Alloalcanivorax gelatiniphagus]